MAGATCYVGGPRTSVRDALANISTQVARAELELQERPEALLQAERLAHPLRVLTAIGAALGAELSGRDAARALAPSSASPDVLPPQQQPGMDARRRLRRLAEKSREELLREVKELQQRVKELQAENCRLAGTAGKKCEDQPSPQAGNVFHLPLAGPPHLPQPKWHWTWEGWVFVVVLLIAALAAAVFSCIWCTFLSPRSLLTDLTGNFGGQSFLYHQPMSAQSGNELQVIGKLLQKEMRMRILTPFLVPSLTFHWTTCADGTPWWGYIVICLFVARAKYLEWWILRKVTKSGWRAMFTFCFTTGLMDHIDWFTDGIFCIQAYRCDPEATLRFTEMINESILSPCLPVIKVLGFWFFAAASLASALLAQQALGSVGKGVTGLASAADVACFGAVAQHYSKLEPEAEKGLMKVAVVFSKIMLKNFTSLWLQSTFFGMAFETLSVSGKAKILFTLSIGCGCAIFKTRSAASVTCSHLWAAVYYGRPDLALLIFSILLVQFCAVCLVAWTITKVYKSFSCPTHMWNISYGCVDDLSQTF